MTGQLVLPGAPALPWPEKCMGCGDRMPGADPTDVYCYDCLPASWA